MGGRGEGWNIREGELIWASRLVGGVSLPASYLAFTISTPGTPISRVDVFSKETMGLCTCGGGMGWIITAV